MRRPRRPLVRSAVVFAAVLATASAVSAVRAQDGEAPPGVAFGRAQLNAVAFEPLPAGRPIRIVVLDDSEDNLAVGRALAEAIRARGLPVTDDGTAPLTLSVETGDAVGAWRTPGDTQRIPTPDDRGRLFPQGELDITRQVQLPLPATTVVTPAQYRLSLSLDDRTSGRRVWQGWSFADLSQGEPAELARAMVPRLAASIGETVREESFALQ